MYKTLFIRSLTVMSIMVSFVVQIECNATNHSDTQSVTHSATHSAIHSVSHSDHNFESPLYEMKNRDSESCGMQSLAKYTIGCSVSALKDWKLNITSMNKSGIIEILCDKEMRCRPHFCCAIFASMACVTTITSFMCTQEEEDSIKWLTDAKLSYLESTICVNISDKCHSYLADSEVSFGRSLEVNHTLGSEADLDNNARHEIHKFEELSSGNKIERFTINLRINGSNGLFPSLATISLLFIFRLFY